MKNETSRMMQIQLYGKNKEQLISMFTVSKREFQVKSGFYKHAFLELLKTEDNWVSSS